jgi:hypothetical protein
MSTLAIVIISLLIAAFFTLFFAFGFRNQSPYSGIWTYFIVLFLGIWVAAIWIRPIGPVFNGIPWVPLFFVGLIIALILAASIPPQHTRRKEERFLNPKPEDATLRLFGAFFWLLLITLVSLIILGYVFFY